MKKNNLKSVMKSIFMITLMFSLMIQTALAGKFIVNTEEFGEVVVEVRERNLFDNLFAVTLNPNTASPGETVTLTWTGDIDYAEQGIAVVQLQINSNYYDITAQSGLDCTGCSAQFSVNFQAPNSPGTYTVQIVIYDYGNQPLTTGAGDTQTLTVENPDQCSSDSDCPSSEFCWFDANPNICWPDYETGNTVQCDRNAQCVSGLCSDNNGALTHPMCIDPVADTCDDSDGGKEYNVPGVAVSSINGQLADSCTSGTQLQEVFCDTDLRWDIEYYTCPDVCNPAGYCDTSTCSPVWNCGSWSACTNDVQTRTCTDSNNCPGETPPTSMTEQSCTIQETCSDGIQNQGETGIDCGGPCQACNVNPTCSDGIQNQGETGIDCGGPCAACSGGGNENDFTITYLKWRADGVTGDTITQTEVSEPSANQYPNYEDKTLSSFGQNKIGVEFKIKNNQDVADNVRWEVGIYPKAMFDKLQGTARLLQAAGGGIETYNCGKSTNQDCKADPNCEGGFVSSVLISNIDAGEEFKFPDGFQDYIILDLPGPYSRYATGDTAYDPNGEYYLVARAYNQCWTNTTPNYVEYDLGYQKFNVNQVAFEPPYPNGVECPLTAGQTYACTSYCQSGYCKEGLTKDTCKDQPQPGFCPVPCTENCGTTNTTGGVYKLTVSYDEVDKLTTAEMLASSCTLDQQCDGHADPKREVDCIPMSTLVKDEYLTETESDSFFSSAKTAVAVGGVGVAVGGACVAALLSNLIPASWGITTPLAIAICGGAITTTIIGADALVSGINDAQADKIGLCIDESAGTGGGFDEFIQKIADDYFNGDKTSATIALVVVFFFAMIIFTRV